jgi:putrescine importer
MKPTETGASPKQQLARTLGLWSIVALGLGYMTPTTIFDTFGIVSDKTESVVPSAYILALIVMMFTAISYGRMTVVFPSAGSAYAYTSATMGPRLGFLIGWSALLDYILLPLVNAVIIRSYLIAFFPFAPAWVSVLIYCIVITGMCLFSMSNTSKLNMILLVFVVTLIGAYLVLANRALENGVGNGTLFSTIPFWHDGVEIGKVMTGTTIVAFSFIGFDAITMYTEEAKDIKFVPKAILYSLLIGGAIFFISAWYTQSLFPDLSAFDEDALQNSALPQIAQLVGGDFFKILLTAGAFAATVSSSLASQASVSRLLYVMGRNGNGPISGFFGYIHPTYKTPFYSVLFVGAVSLLGITLNLDFVASLINFGALVAFTFVNLSVIFLFAIKRKEVNGIRQIFRNIILPSLGIIMTVMMWLHLSHESTLYGGIWFMLGFVVLLWMTKFFKKPMPITLGEGH